LPLETVLHLLPTAQKCSAKAAQAAFRLLPAIEVARAKGITSLAGLAAELNAQGVLATGGSAWNATSVKRLLARLKGMEPVAVQATNSTKTLLN